MSLKVEWLDRGLAPACPSDPAYPDGIDLDLSQGNHACSTALPYPAPRIGAFVVACDVCGRRVSFTTAGRPDDPRSVKIPCRRGYAEGKLLQ